MDMKLLHQKFCRESFDQDGVICRFEPVYDEHFNYAYDVIDEIARNEPQRRAMVWCNVAGEQRTFTFGEISEYASRAAALCVMGAGAAHSIPAMDRVAAFRP